MSVYTCHDCGAQVDTLYMQKHRDMHAKIDALMESTEALLVDRLDPTITDKKETE